MLISRYGLVVVTAIACLVGLPASASAGSRALPREYYEVDVAVPGHLQADVGGIWTVTPKSEVKIVAARRILAVWANTLFGGAALTTTRAVALAKNTSLPSAVAVVDRPLTPAERRTLVARPLYVDGDVLLVSPRNPLCGGATSDVARRIVSGEVTDWAQLGYTDDRWPDQVRPDLFLFAPTIGRSPAQPHFGAAVGTTAYRAVEAEMPAKVLSYADGAVAVARYSGIRRIAATSGACVVPIDGVAPSDASVRSHAYPPSWTTSWVAKRTVDKVSARYRTAFTLHLFGARGARLLHSATTRDHLSPS